MFSMGPAGSLPPSGPQRLTGMTREDGSYELLAGAAGDYSATVESTDGRTAYLTRKVQIPDADSYVLDLDLAGASVTGMVMDKETERPLADARVLASKKDGGSGSATLGRDGRFQLELEPGDYNVLAQLDGYVGTPVEATVGATGTSEIRIPLARGARLSGRVVDARGRPVSGALVNARAASASAPGMGFLGGLRLRREPPGVERLDVPVEGQAQEALVEAEGEPCRGHRPESTWSEAIRPALVGLVGMLPTGVGTLPAAL